MSLVKLPDWLNFLNKLKTKPMKTKSQIKQEIDKIEQEIISNPDIDAEAKKLVVEFRKACKELSFNIKRLHYLIKKKNNKTKKDYFFCLIL